MLEVATNSDCGLIVMHMAGNPQNMQEKPSYSNVVKDIMKFFNQQLNSCEENGIKKVLRYHMILLSQSEFLVISIFLDSKCSM